MKTNTHPLRLLPAFLACLLAAALPAVAALPPPPEGLVPGARLSKPGFGAADWEISAGTTVAADSITVTSENNNPLLGLSPSFDGDILLRVRLRDIDKNDNVRLVINNGGLVIVFSRQYSHVTLGKAESIHEEIVEVFAAIPYKDGHIPATDPSDFVLTLALASGKAVLWIDSQRIQAVTMPGLAALSEPWNIQFRSGWMSNWSLADFAIFSLSSKRKTG